MLAIFRFRLSLLIGMLMVGTFVSAQQATIIGLVVNESNGQPLSYVTVAIPDLATGTYTDQQGSFSVSGIPYGTYEVRFSFVGFVKQSIKIKVDEKVEQLKVYLSESVENLNEILVVGELEEVKKAREVMKKVMPVTVLTSKDMENRASNLNELLTRQAGVQIRRTGGFGSSATISVRGLEGKRVQVFIDGNPVNTPDGSFGINDIPLQLIERVEIYKGTIPAHLGGDGLGSAVNVVTKHRDYSYIDVNVARQSFNTTNTGLIIKKVFENQGIETGIGIFDNRSDNDYIMQSPYQQDLEINRDHDKFRNTLIGGSVRFHRLWFDEVEVEFARNDVFKEFQGIQRNIQHVETTAKTSVLAGKVEKTGMVDGKLNFKMKVLGLRIRSTFSDTSSFAYNWDGSRIPSLIGRGELGIGPNLSNTNQQEIRARENFNYTINPSLSINLNHNFRASYFNPQDDLGNEYAGRNIYNYDGNLKSSVTGLTAEARLMDDKFLISSALKHYYNLVTGFNTNLYVQGEPEEVSNTTNKFGYNFGLRYNLTNALFFKASHEFAIRLPLAAEMFGDGALITPSINLNPEEAYNYSLGLVYDRYYHPQKRVQLETNAFYLDVDHLIQLAGAGLTTGFINYSKAQIMGVDLDCKLDLTSHFFMSLNATWQSIKDINEYIPGTNDVSNPTYSKEIPNIPKLFSNWSLEYHSNDLLGKDSNTRIIYEGSHINEYSFGFELSVNDQFMIPTSLAHNFIIEHSLSNQKFTITGQVQNFTNAVVLNNWNQPLPGRSFRIKIRMLLMDKKSKHQTNSIEH